MWTLEVAKLWMTSTMDKKELEPLWLKRDKQGTRKIKIGQHSGWKEMQDLIRWKWLESNGFNRMTALRYKKRAEIYNSLKSSRAKYFIGVTSQRIIDEISKYEDRKEILYYLEEMNNYDEIENFLKKDVVLEIEEKTEKENIEIKERIKKLPLKNIERLDNEKKNQVNELVQKIEEILKEMKWDLNLKKKRH